MHYATVGTSMATEIFRSITKTFEDKVMQCVPPSVNIFSNSSRMDVLIRSGGTQIAYHSLLSITGAMRQMIQLPGLNLRPKQIFVVLFVQQMCSEAAYSGVDIYSEDFADM